MNWGTWMVGAVILAVLALAVRKLCKDRKNGAGCGGCCDSCGGCPVGGRDESV